MDSVKVFLRLYWLQTCMQLLSASEALLMDSCSKVSIASRYLNTECPSAWYMLLLCLRTEQKFEICPNIRKIYSQRLEQRSGFIELVVEKQVDGVLRLQDRGFQTEVIRKPTARTK